MKKHRLELALGFLFTALFVALCLWLNPGNRGKLAPAEVDVYIGRMEGKLPAPPAEEAEFLARLRAWASADDGRPVYMLNVMSYHDTLRRVPGAETITASPVAANAIYERSVMPMLFQLGGYPLFGGDSTGIRTASGPHSDVVGMDGSVDDTDRILVVRYPNRRAFLRLVADPQYLKFAPYKFSALKLGLVPLEAETIIPDPRWAVGALLLIVFLGFGWLRSANRARTSVNR